MPEVAEAEPCADCLGLVGRVGAWASAYHGYDAAVWGQVLGPHPNLNSTNGTPFQCRACGCCWSLNENPDFGYVNLERLAEREYRRRLTPSRWSPPFWEGRWGAVVLLYAPLLVASVGLTAVVVWFSASAGGLGNSWPTLLLLLALASAFMWGLVRAVRGR